MNNSKVLLTGKNSNIGSYFEKYLKEHYPSIFVEKVSIRGDEWKNKSWKSFDTVLHIAGYTKSDNGNISVQEQQKYHDINITLTEEVLKKAKKDGVKHFIFLSTMMVYGNVTPFFFDNSIKWITKPQPQSYYGRTKLKAEELVKKYEAEDFKVLIIREPIVYGEGLDGEIPKWLKLSKWLLFFPKLKTTRSAIYIINLCELFRLCIEQERTGLICPRNREQYTLSEIIKIMRKLQGKRTIIVSGCTFFLKWFSCVSQNVNQLLGNLFYDDEMVEYDNLPYNIYTTEESYKRMLEYK